MPDFLSLLSLAILGYTYAGYPLLIASLARLFPLRPDPDPDPDPGLPRVSILLPVADAAPWLPAKLDSLLGQDYPPDRLEVLVYSDSPTDGGDAILAAAAARDARIAVIRAPDAAVRRGKPHALNQLRRHATGEIVILTDARQPLTRTAVRELVRQLADPSVGCAAGRLLLAGAAGSAAYWRYESFIRRAEARFRSQIGASGALYAIRRSELPELPEDTILDDVWIPMHVRLGGRRIAACEAAVAHDEAFEDGRELRRKVRTLAGNYQLFARLPALLVPWRNPSWFETVSHRLLRLVCPWALILLAAASILGAAAGSRLGRALAAGQAAFYLLAALGPRAGRAGSLARTFVVLNAAAIMGLWRWVKGRQPIAW